MYLYIANTNNILGSSRLVYRRFGVDVSNISISSLVIITNIILRPSGHASCGSKVKQDEHCIQHESDYLKAGIARNQEWIATWQ